MAFHLCMSGQSLTHVTLRVRGCSMSHFCCGRCANQRTTFAGPKPQVVSTLETDFAQRLWRERLFLLQDRDFEARCAALKMLPKAFLVNGQRAAHRAHKGGRQGASHVSGSSAPAEKRTCRAHIFVKEQPAVAQSNAALVRNGPCCDPHTQCDCVRLCTFTR